MHTLDMSPGQTIRIGNDIRINIVLQGDGSIGFDIEASSPVQVLPGEFVGLELHQLQVLSMNDL